MRSVDFSHTYTSVTFVKYELMHCVEIPHVDIFVTIQHYVKAYVPRQRRKITR
jgi:hypothetical protein